MISSTTARQNHVKIYHEVPSLQVSQYVKRPELLKAIETGFSDATESTPGPKKVVLLGMGGQGKTQLALEYCSVARASETYQAIFWIDASSSNTALRGFETIAAKISDPGHVFDDIESKVDFVKQTLGAWERPWLMVFDNYDRPNEFKDISTYIPQGQTGAILFTSRHADSERLGTIIKLTQMTEGESLELILRQSKRERNEESSVEGLKIVKKLGYLPLAIDQAGAYIRQRNLSLSRFMQHYEDRKEYVLKHTPSLWEYRRKLGKDKDETLLSVFTTWELSFQQIGKNDDERMMIGHFLTLSAFLDASNVGISGDLFKLCATSKRQSPEWIHLFTSGGSWDQYKYEDIIAELGSLSLLQIADTGSAVSHFFLHPLVTDWFKLRTDQKGREDFTIEATVILAEYIGEQDRHKLPLKTKQYLLAHMDSCLHNDKEYLKDLDKSDAFRREAANTFASFYGTLDRYLEAEALYQRALAGSEKALGPGHISTLDTVNNLGVLYWNQGKLAEAEAMYQRALTGSEKALGPEHTSTLDIVHNLGILYQDQGKLAEAEAVYQRALVGKEKALGPEHTSTLNTVNNLGTLYRNQGRLAEAEAMYQRALVGYEKALGPEHTSTLGIVSNLDLLRKKTREVY